MSEERLCGDVMTAGIGGQDIYVCSLPWGHTSEHACDGAAWTDATHWGEPSKDRMSR